MDNDNKLIHHGWKSFKENRTNSDLYSENTVIMFVPTLIGTRGNGSQIRKFFLHPQFSDKICIIQETVYNTLISNHKLIEEVVWKVHFKGSECKWLLPNLQENHSMINTTIQFPLTLSASFDTKSHKIESIRYFWDQACILKQLNMMSSSLVVGEQQIETLCSPHRVQLTGLTNQDEVMMKPSSSRNIFTYQPPPQRPMVSPSNKLNSTFKFTHDDGTSQQSTHKEAISSSLPAAGKPTPRIHRNVII
ncbi:uncharacterized protein BX663DRAFT_429698 [Cokeromyces recurvatus]|uniref:uncharacterized protein n=1 Tax=Cokeromyces recurvatus TaxID=90255 RepID=UPI00221F3602|nr:uncharacterized protein BX663DRAFT_429698 [Cokeromyces recurvatus]KAI7905702.1 hypothetical protein BX663DRAFT_429698 [Cokeromyces recurvatus]